MYASHAEDNPFHQPEGYWVIRFTVPRTALEIAETAFENVAVSVSTFEADPEGNNWQVEALCEEEVPAEEIQSRLHIIAAMAQCPTPAFETQYLVQRDWVSEVQKSFPPMHAGRYFIYGSHYEEHIPASTIPIQIDAGMAFGSGEHETTSGCLEALDDLSRKAHFTRMLDMGCGSGILAIAMAKTWRKPVVAVDIDAVAVKVTEENAHRNGVANLLRTAVSDGYRHCMVREYAPYQLIVANILARPLVELAGDLSLHLAPNGVAILSGLLERQEAQVLAAHRHQGLYLQERYAKNGWHTLVLGKKS